MNGLHEAGVLGTERHGLVGSCPEEGHRNNPRGGIPLLQGQTGRAGAVQPKEEKAERGYYQCL